MNQAANVQYAKAQKEIGWIIEELKRSRTAVMPTEAELARRLQVGRNTVRRALGPYVKEGLLERIKGKGTFLIEKPLKMSFSSWVPTEPPGDVFLREVIEKFHSLHEGSVVELVPANFDNYLASLLQLYLSGKAPDVIELNPTWLHALVRLDLLLPLDNLVGQVNLKRRYPLELESETYNGKLYAVSWTLSPQVLYYNKTVLERAGLDPSRPPATMDELAEMCVAVNAANDKTISGIALPLDLTCTHPFYPLYPLLLSLKGGLLDAMGNLIVDSEDNANALRWLTDLYNRGAVKGECGINQGRVLFATDRIAFWVDGPAGRGFFRQISEEREGFDERYGVTRIPVGNTRRSESLLLGHALGVSRLCRDPRLAGRWVEYLTTDEEHAKSYFKMFGMLPSIRDLLQKPFFESDPFASVFVHQLETASSPPTRHPLVAKALPLISQAFDTIILHDLDPKEKLCELRKTIELLGRNKTLCLLHQ